MKLLEEWRTLDGYKISNMGRCLSPTGRELKQAVNGRGYLQVSFHASAEFVHRLVLKAFKPKHPKDHTQCDHIDMNRRNNCVTNLRWCSQSQNIRARHLHRKKLGLSPTTEKEQAHLQRLMAIRAELSRKPVCYMGQVYPSLSALAEKFDVSIGAISKALAKGTWRGHEIRFAS